MFEGMFLRTFVYMSILCICMCVCVYVYMHVCMCIFMFKGKQPDGQDARENMRVICR